MRTIIATSPQLSNANERQWHRRIGWQIERTRRHSAGDKVRAERSDHGAVVGAERRPRYADGDAMLCGSLLRQGPNPRVSRDATADDQRLDPVVETCRDRLR